MHAYLKKPCQTEKNKIFLNFFFVIDNLPIPLLANHRAIRVVIQRGCEGPHVSMRNIHRLLTDVLQEVSLKGLKLSENFIYHKGGKRACFMMLIMFFFFLLRVQNLMLSTNSFCFPVFIT